MKIAFVEDNFLLWERQASFQASGVTPSFMLTRWESTMDLYAGALQRLGHECVKYVPSLGKGEVEHLRHSLGHTVVRVPCSVGAWPLLARVDWRALAIPFTRRIAKEKFLAAADVVHYHSYYSSFFLASTMLGRGAKRTAQYTGGSLPVGYSATRRRVASYLLVRALRGARAVILDDKDPESRGQAAFLEAAGVPPERVHKLPTLIVDRSVFRVRDKAETRAQLGIDQRPLVIVVVSAVMEEPPEGDVLTKNPFQAVRLFAKLAQTPGLDVQLHVVGGGAGLPSLKELAIDLGQDGRVFFHGVVPHDQVALYVAASDLVFVPYRFLELNYGTAVLEAFSCGRPACGFKRLPEAEVDRPGGFLVDPDAQTGASELAARLQDPAYLAEKAREGLPIAEEHEAGPVARGLELAFEAAARH